MSNLTLADGVHAIRFMLVYTNNVTSWLIAKEGLPWGGFSHAMNLLRDGSVIDARYDMQPCVDGVKRTGVQHRPYDYEEWTRVMVVEIPISADRERAGETWLRKQIGDAYDGEAIRGFIEGARAHMRRHWICSALCVAHGRHAGVFHNGHISIMQDSDISPDVLAAVATLGAGGKVTMRYGL